MQHHFDVDVAMKVGVTEAVLLDNFAYWTKANEANHRNEYDGRVWTYNTLEALQQIFPYLSANQIRYALSNLVKNGYVVTGNYNANPFDRTKWYALTDDGRRLVGLDRDTASPAIDNSPACICENSQLQSAESTNVNTLENVHLENTNNSVPPSFPPQGETAVAEDDGFATFWEAYPKKQAKTCAERAWKRVPKGQHAALMTALEKHKALPQWNRDGGQYIPLASTWLNQKRWEDEVDTTVDTRPRTRAADAGFAQRTYTEDDFKDLYVDLTQFGN